MDYATVDEHLQKIQPVPDPHELRDHLWVTHELLLPPPLWLWNTQPLCRWLVHQCFAFSAVNSRSARCVPKAGILTGGALKCSERPILQNLLVTENGTVCM